WCLDLLRALRDPRQHGLVADLLAGSPSPGHDEDVERRTGLECRIGKDAQAAGRHHRFGALGDQKDLERRGLLSAPLFVEAGIMAPPAGSRFLPGPARWLYASSAWALIAIVPSGVTAHSSQPRPSAVGRPRSSNGALSNSGARACIV